MELIHRKRFSNFTTEKKVVFIKQNDFLSLTLPKDYLACAHGRTKGGGAKEITPLPEIFISIS